MKACASLEINKKTAGECRERSYRHAALFCRRLGGGISPPSAGDVTRMENYTCNNNIKIFLKKYSFNLPRERTGKKIKSCVGYLVTIGDVPNKMFLEKI